MKNSFSLAHLAFLALFPGFFFYQSALGLGDIPAVLGGYFSPVALAFAPVLATLYLVKVKRERHFLARTDFLFFCFLLYFFFVVALNFSIGADKDIVASHLVAIIHFFVVFLIFRMAEFNSKTIKWSAFLCLIGMTFLIFYFSVDGSFYLKQEGNSSDSESVATYQGFARSYFLTFLIVMPFMKRLPMRLLAYLICVPALFLNGARSELMALIVAIVLIEISHARYWLALLVGSLIIFTPLILYFDDIIRMLPDNRSLELLHLSQSSSWEARKFLFAHALRTIGQNPLLGDYANYFGVGIGAYAHNIFSAWVDLGLFGFLYLLCMLVFPMYFLFVDVVFRKGKTKPDELVLAFSLMFVTLFLLFTSKSYTYMLIAAALGSYSSYRSTHIRTARSMRRNDGLLRFSVRYLPTSSRRPTTSSRI
jgi:hypothetical protein